MGVTFSTATCSDEEAPTNYDGFLGESFKDQKMCIRDRCIPSPKGVPFDQKPELSLPEVADTVTEALGRYDFIVTNFANGDVVGHTLNSAAKLAACREVSRSLQQVVSADLREDYVVAVSYTHLDVYKRQL